MVHFNDIIEKFQFYANCRFSAVNGLISIFYIASQIKAIVFKYPPYSPFKEMYIIRERPLFDFSEF